MSLEAESVPSIRPITKTTPEDQWSDSAAVDGEECPSHPLSSSIHCNNTCLAHFVKDEKATHVLPHQLMLKPPFGYWTAKKTTTRLIATPASRAADNM